MLYLIYASLGLSALAVLLVFAAISLTPSKEQRRREIVDVLAELEQMRAREIHGAAGSEMTEFGLRLGRGLPRNLGRGQFRFRRFENPVAA